MNLFQNCNGSFDGYIVKENSVDHKLIHLDSITATPVIRGTFPTSVARIAGLSNFLVSDIGVTCMATMAYSQKLLRFNYGTCNSTNAYSFDKFPPPVSFTTPGSRYVRLIVDQGLPTESSYCEEVNVSAVNNNVLNLGPDTMNCYESAVSLHAGPGFASYHWQDGFADSVYTAFAPGIYSVTVTNYCGQTFVDSMEVMVDSTTQIALRDTTICAKDSVLLTSPSGFTSYQWTPSNYLGCSTCQNTYAKPGTTIIYTLTALTPNGCMSIGTAKITVTSCTGVDEMNRMDWRYVRPNPVKDQLEIGLSGAGGRYAVKIYNALGQVIKNQQEFISTENAELRVDVSSLATGLYFLEVKNDKGALLITKVVKE
ncbi:MAG: T9SS type A sorting domain-containing protein [Bacteroidetes bacterium]|nr:T9SS type A sorting domain-containing protein [Bacteroidota bacterium]